MNDDITFFDNIKHKMLDQRIDKARYLIERAKANQAEIPRLDSQIEQLSHDLDAYYVIHTEITRDILVNSI